jgi:hypothetical protein
MSNQIETSFIQGFKQGIDLLSQQRGSKLQNAVRNEMQSSKQDHYDQISRTSVVQRTTRHSDTPLVNTPHSRRNVTLNDYEWADLIDRQDRLRLLNDPGNAYSTNAAYAMGRKKDELILDAFTKTQTTGELADGGAAPAVVTIFGASTGNQPPLTVENLINARTHLLAEDDTDEEMFVALTAYQIAQLMDDNRVSSADYNTVRALVAGQIDTFLGFKFIQVANTVNPVTDGTAGADNSSRPVYFWKRSGILLATGMGESGSSARITERADKSYSTQIYYSASFGSARMEEAKCCIGYAGDDATA